MKKCGDDLIFGGFVQDPCLCCCMFVRLTNKQIDCDKLKVDLGLYVVAADEQTLEDSGILLVRVTVQSLKTPVIFSHPVPISPTVQSPDSSQGVEAGRHLRDIES
jgi:hypothetical protein